MARDRSKHFRSFCFTWNNYPSTAEAELRQFFDVKQPLYMIVGKEVGENGTPHLQGFMQLKDRMSFARLKAVFPSMHIERAKGNAEQNRTYCSKEQNFFEMGTCPRTPGKASKESWKDILDAAEAGNWSFLKTEYPRIWVTMSEKLISKRVPDTTIIDGPTVNEWWYGRTGTGKSRLAWEKYGSICYQKMLNKWWDGYDAQPVVVIEEWSPKNDVTASALKIWADRYPFTAQIKGGVLQKIRPYKIIVISNYKIDDCFVDTRDAEPIKRRFTEYEFPDDVENATRQADLFHEMQSIQDAVPESPLLGEELTLSELLPTHPNTPTTASSSGHSCTSNHWLDYATIEDFNRVIEHAASFEM